MLKTVLHHNTCTLSYADDGDPNGFPILIQHGLIASIQDSHLFERLVSSGRRVISIARPGYGDSSPYELANIAEWGQIISGLVDHLQLARFDVLGISSGAPYCYAIGYRLPEKARRLFILSGTPALYDEAVLAHWPYPVNRNAGLAELQTLARELFFAHQPAEDLAKADVQDSMRNDCFGIALDLKIRCLDWGFRLADIQSRVIMRHSRADQAVPLRTAELTARMLPNCRLEIHEQDDHFSQAVLDDFITSVILSANLK